MLIILKGIYSFAKYGTHTLWKGSQKQVKE